MTDNICFFINRDLEIRDLKFIIREFLSEGKKVYLISSTISKKKKIFSIKTFGIEEIYNDFKKNKNFIHRVFTIKENNFLNMLRYISSFHAYEKRGKIFHELKKRFCESNPRFNFFYSNFKFLFKSKAFIYLNTILLKIFENFFYDKKLEEFLKNINPNFVFFTPHVLDVTLKQNEIIKVCNKLNIRSSFIVRSWDNLTNKASMNIEPSDICVWNKFQKEELEKFHNIKNSRIHITGAHLYEYLLEPPVVNKETETINKRKIITYFGSSPQIVEDEFDYILDLVSLIKKQTNLFDQNIIFKFRPHPLNIHKKYLDDINLFKQKIKNLKYQNIEIIPDLNPENIDEFYKNIMNKKIYVDTMIESNLLIGVNTSAMVEANFYGKKIIQIPNELTLNHKGLFNNTYHSTYLNNSSTAATIQCNNFEDMILKITNVISNNEISKVSQEFKKEFLNLSNKPSKNLINLVNRN